MRIVAPIPKRTETSKKEKEKTRITFQVPGVMCHMSRVLCHISHVACRVSRVTWHLSLTPTATARDPPFANSPTMHRRLVRNDPKTQRKQIRGQKVIKTAELKKSRGMPILVIHSDTLSSPSGSGASKRGQTDRQTNITTYRLNWLRGWFSEKVMQD